MDKKTTSDLPLSYSMFESTSRVGWTQLLNPTPEEKRIFKVLDFYLNHAKLKELERTGWIKWNVSGRRESVAEHSSSAQGIAWALYSEYELELDIYKVISMLSIHEEGESIIGDIIKYDVKATETKAEREKAAVDSICGNLKRGNIIVSLFDEFEAKETPEAKFAFLCDKLDCDLQAKLYSDRKRCSIANATYEMVSNEQIQEILENGAKTVFEVFWEADMHYYTDSFLEGFFLKLKEL